MLMKQVVFLVCIVSLSLAVFGQKRGATGDTRESQIKLMDRQWIIEAYSSRDLKDFDRIVADDFLITAANGKAFSKAEKRASVAKDYTAPETMSSPDYIFKIEADGHKVSVFDKTAVSTGYITENYVWKGTKINNRGYFHKCLCGTEWQMASGCVAIYEREASLTGPCRWLPEWEHCEFI